MQVIPTTRERGLAFKTRIGEVSVPKRFIFTNTDSTGHDISGEDFELLIKQQPGASTNLVRLTVGSGLTISGDDNHILTYELTAEQTQQKPNVYFGLLRSQDADSTWFNFDWEFFNGKYEGVGECDDTEISICLNGSDILVTITNCNDVGVTQAELTAALALKADLNTRSTSTVSTATLTPNIDLYDLFVISAQAEALVIANPTGTAVLGNGFMIDIEDNGTARAITYGNQYTETFVDLPSTTVLGKRMKLVFQYNGTNWELLNVINEQ